VPDPCQAPGVVRSPVYVPPKRGPRLPERWDDKVLDAPFPDMVRAARGRDGLCSRIDRIGSDDGAGGGVDRHAGGVARRAHPPAGQRRQVSQAPGAVQRIRQPLALRRGAFARDADARVLRARVRERHVVLEPNPGVLRPAIVHLDSR